MGEPNRTTTGTRGTARRRIGVICVAAALAMAVVACGTDREAGSASDTPGFRDQEWSIDTTPFELAKPVKVGGSTIPEAVLDPETDPTIPATTSPPPPAPTTTTTTLPLPSSDPVCVAYHRWITLTRAYLEANTAPETYATQAVVTMRTMAGLLSGSGNPAFGPAATLFSEGSGRLEGATTADQVEGVILPIITEADPAVIAAVQPLRVHVEQECSELRAAALE